MPKTNLPRIPLWLLLVPALLAFAILGAGYLAWVSLSSGPLAGCGPDSGCAKVLQSRWAYWLGIPVSLPALLAYLGLLGTVILAVTLTSPDDERGAWVAIVALSVIIAGAALWFIGLQIFVIKAFCKFCMATHSCGLLAAALCLKNIPLATDPATPMWSAGSDKPGVPRQALLSILSIGLAGVAVLVAGQCLVPPRQNIVVASHAANARGPIAGAPRGQADYRPPTPNARLVAPGLLSLYSNQFLIWLDAVPVLGSPNCTNIIVNLFDYSCHHCRNLRAILENAQRQLSNGLAIVSLPVPSSTNCNPTLPQSFFGSSNSCDYAHLGLAVWRAKPEAHRQFEDWFFKPEQPAPVEQVRDYAAQLVGADKLETALADPWLTQQITTDCQIHFANWAATGEPGLPQLILSDAVSIGPLNSVNHLFRLLRRYLGMEIAL